MKSKTVLLSLAIFCILSLACFQGGIAETLQDVNLRGRLIAGVRTDMPPFGFVDGKGVVRGIDIDIARALAKELLGKEDAVEFVTVAEEGGGPLLNANRVDLLLGGMIIGESNGEVLEYSIPYYEAGHLILARRDSRVSRYQDLAGKKVATIQGTTGDATVRELVPQARRIVFTNHSEAIQALKDRRVDALVDNNRMVIHFERRDPKFKIAGYQPFGSVSYGLGVRKGDGIWLGFINATLTKMKETNQYERLLEKWFAESMALLLGFERPMEKDNGKKEEVR